MIPNNTLLRNTNFNTHYVLETDTDFVNLAYNLNNSTFIETIKGLFEDKNQYLLSVMALAVSPNGLYNILNLENVKIGDKTLDNATTSNHEVKGYRINNTYSPVEYSIYLTDGIIISPYYNDFRDYNEHIELYLPYANTLTLDAKEVMGRKFKIYYDLDLDAGAITYYIMRKRVPAVAYPDDYEQFAIATGKCGFEIPIGKTNNSELVRNIINATLTIGASTVALGSGNPLAIAGGVASIARAGLNIQHKTEKGITNGGISSASTSKAIKLIRRRVQYANTRDDYKSYRGLPLMQNRTLNNLNGYTICKSVHVENIPNATEAEKRNIESLLLSGVIL